jgi:Zn-dependent M28 family amino/carboxypeptidase
MLDISIDHQVVSGHNFERSVYKNIQNIVVRYQGNTDNVLMLNCHFDSIAGSPGASDDIVMCCVMMEILRVLSRSVKKQKHSIIFLFNGSEEEDLQASHGFITKHKWAKDVKAYINLESTGSDGREILFRTGPKHDWLIRLYRKSVPRPFGHSVAEELFETGIIPSATGTFSLRLFQKIRVLY